MRKGRSRGWSWALRESVNQDMYSNGNVGSRGRVTQIDIGNLHITTATFFEVMNSTTQFASIAISSVPGMSAISNDKIVCVLPSVAACTNGVSVFNWNTVNQFVLNCVRVSGSGAVYCNCTVVWVG